METICASVSKDILKKADRLFTGSVDGRIAEMLQNSRRAGATEIYISNSEGMVTIKDNGKGIGDFQTLLDLGACGWNEDIITGEDAAGVGFFSIMPRTVNVKSGKSEVTISGDGWIGKVIPVNELEKPVKGTVISFKDEIWTYGKVNECARYSGLTVFVDGKKCEKQNFVTSKSVLFPDIGCKIQVTEKKPESVETDNLSWRTNTGIFINYHGVVLETNSKYSIDGRDKRYVRVDIEDVSKIRLLLPARTKIVENEAYKVLMDIVEKEFLKSFIGEEHHLDYEMFKRAKELGIVLDEAVPEIKPYTPSLCFCDLLEELPVTGEIIGKANKYLVEMGFLDDEAETNTYLFAMFGTVSHNDFLPVEIKEKYNGYSWTKLPKVTKIAIDKGKKKTDYSFRYKTICVHDALTMTVETSDSETFSSKLPVALESEEFILVTLKAEEEVDMRTFLYLDGGFSDDGDTYKTQEYYFEKDLNEFWNSLKGEYEVLKQHLMEKIRFDLPYDLKWSKISITKEKALEIEMEDSSVVKA